MEGPRGAMQRGPSNQIPATPAEEELIGVDQAGAFFAVQWTAITNSYASPLGNGFHQLIEHRLVPQQTVAGRHNHLQGFALGAQLLAQAFGEATGEFQDGASGRFEEGQLRAAAQVAAQHDQRQGFLRREVGGREEVGFGDVIALLAVVVLQRDARLSKYVQIAKDGPAADLAGLSQGLSVVPPSTLKRAQQFQKTTDSREVHSFCWPIAGCPSSRCQSSPHC